MTERLRAWTRHRPLAADGLFAAALVLVEVLFVLLTPREFWPRQLPAALVWSALAAAPVALRRVAPWPAVGAAVATCAVPALLGHAPITQGLAFVVLTYTMAAHRSVRPAVLAAVLLWVPVAVTNAVAPL